MARPFSQIGPDDYIRTLETRVRRLERRGVTLPPALQQAMVSLNAVRLDEAVGLTSPSPGYVYVAAEEPEAPSAGDIWRDTSYPDESIDRIFTANGWERITDPLVSEALTSAQVTMQIVGGDEMPVGDEWERGSLWRDPETGILYRWDGQEWIDTTVGDLSPLGPLTSWISGTGNDLLDRLNAAFPDGEFDVGDAIALTIKSYVNEYAVSGSETVPPTSGWSTATPVRTPGTYIWFRTVVTYGDDTTSTSSPALLTGNDGAPGTPPALISLTASTQVLVVPAGGGATTPATATITGVATDTSITDWQYSVDGGAFTTTPPAGVSRSGDTVTVTGASVTARTLSVRASDASGVSDTITVAKVIDGAEGAPGAPGADAYTVLLTNESHTFPGDNDSALAGSTISKVIAYEGAVQQTATIGTITGQVTGLTTSIQNNGTVNAQFTVNVTTSLTTASGVLTVPVTVDGHAFTKTFSWTLTLEGAPGAPGVGITSITPYYRQEPRPSALPAKPTTNPPPAPWTTTEPTWVDSTDLYRTERIIYTNGTFAYTDVSKSSAYAAADAAMVSANGKNIITYTDVAAVDKPGPTPTSGAGRVIGDTHRNRDTITGEIYAEWRWGGTPTASWQPIKYGDAILTSLDVGKLTAGSAAIQTAVIEKLWVDVVRSRQITTDMILIGDPSNWLDNPRTDVAGGGWNGAVPVSIASHPSGGNGAMQFSYSGATQYLTNRTVPTTPDDIWYLSIKARRTTTGSGVGNCWLVITSYDAAGNPLTQSTAANWTRTQMGVVNTWYTFEGTARPPAGAVACRFELWFSSDWGITSTAQFTDAVMRKTNARLQLGDTSQVHVIGESNSMTVYAPGDLYPDGSRGPARPMSQMGGSTGGSFMAFDPATGNELGGLASDGSISTPLLSAGAISLGNIPDLAAYLADQPVAVAHGFNTVSHSGYTAETGLVRFTLRNLKANRRYELYLSFRKNLSTLDTRARVRLRATTTTTAPTVASQEFSAFSYVTLNPTTYPFMTPATGVLLGESTTFTWIATQDIPRLNLLLTGDRWTGTGTIATDDYTVIVKDMGAVPEITLEDAFVAPTTQPFNETFTFASHSTYSQYGATVDPYKPYYVRHGRGGSSNYFTFLPIPTAARNMITAGGVTNIRVRLTQAQDNYLSSIIVGTYTGSPTSSPTVGNASSLTFSVEGGGSMSHGKNGWLTLTSAQRLAVIGGANIIIGRNTVETLASYYGTASGTASYRPRINIVGSQ